MPHPGSEYYKNYYIEQAQQKGGSLPAFRGATIQQGYGLGSILKGLYRWAVPHLSSGMKAVGREALKGGLNVAQDVLEGQDLKDSTLKRVNEAGKRLANSQDTSGAQTGSGQKGRKRKTPVENASSPPAKKQRTSKAKKSPYNFFQ